MKALVDTLERHGHVSYPCGKAFRSCHHLDLVRFVSYGLVFGSFHSPMVS
ncbi:hypothetical protein F383_27741 [Gossypium arboreum]|uniref:Uncharacterized protein n=1 Tax=Gossypium arboreum TaxID=29729 RepID=A0A0B0PFR9_GOSAR|nr:hypothetical protein F383_27741 [Gossypium arboreum]